MKENNYTEYSLHNIKDISSLEELVKFDKQIYKHAKMVVGHINQRSKAKDLVQEFYLKMYDYFQKNPNKKINGGFIATTLKNKHTDEYRYNKRYDLGGSVYDGVETYLTEVEGGIEEHKETEIDYYLTELDNIVNNELTGEEKLLIELTYDMNLSELSRETEISYSNLRYTYLKAKNKIEQKIKEKRF